MYGRERGREGGGSKEGIQEVKREGLKKEEGNGVIRNKGMEEYR